MTSTDSKPNVTQPSPYDFRHDLEAAINRARRENRSNTPDFILAAFMAGCLGAFEAATKRREEWYGVELAPGVVSDVRMEKNVQRLMDQNVAWARSYAELNSAYVGMETMRDNWKRNSEVHLENWIDASRDAARYASKFKIACSWNVFLGVILAGIIGTTVVENYRAPIDPPQVLQPLKLLP